MTRYLVDTHIFLWMISEPERLSNAARRVLESPSYETYLSLASLWEIGIKVALQKLTLAERPEIFCARALEITGIQLLNIQPAHVYRSCALPFHHRDPFDRMLVAQAKQEELVLISNDAMFRKYRVRTVR
jgi:PIN domain nuclease of toxin-antitoxin system